MEMLRNLRPTSKASLKYQCLIIAKGDVDEAKKLYEFYIDGMEDLPMFDPQPTSWTDDIGGKINGVFDWIRNNQDVISQGVDFVNGMIQRRRGNVPNVSAPNVNTDVPPINPLPKINE